MSAHEIFIRIEYYNNIMCEQITLGCDVTLRPGDLDQVVKGRVVVTDFYFVSRIATDKHMRNAMLAGARSAYEVRRI